MKPKDTIANLVNSMGNLDMDDEEDTDDEDMVYHANMVRHRTSIDAPSDVIDVRAHFEYGDNDCFKDKMYAILDGGAYCRQENRVSGNCMLK